MKCGRSHSEMEPTFRVIYLPSSHGGLKSLSGSVEALFDYFWITISLAEIKGKSEYLKSMIE